MSDRDELEQNLPAYLDRHAAAAPLGLLDDLLRETAALPQRHGRLAFGSLAWWGVGSAIAAALLILAVALRTGLPAPPVGPGAPVSPAPSAQQSLTTVTLAVPVRDKAIVDRAMATLEARLRALGIDNFSAMAGDDLIFRMVIPASVDRPDVEAVLHRVGEVEWLAWPDDLPWPSEGDRVPAEVVPLFDAADQIKSVTVRTGSPDASVGMPPGVEVQFGPVASEALATYTESHVGLPMPLAMDGEILISPIIQGAISSGDLFIAMVPDGPISPAALAAILKSGPLPEGWTTN